MAFSWAGKDYAWLSPQIAGLLLLALLMLSIFVFVERKAAEPILPLNLFQDKIFTLSTVIVFLQGMGLFGSMMFIPLFIQGVSGATATNSGLVMMPMMLANVSASALSGQLVSRIGKYRWISIIGMGMVVLGSLFLAGMDVGTTHAQVVRYMIILGIGLGVTMPIYVLIVQNTLPYQQLGVGTAAVQFFRSIGGTIGVAVMGSLMTFRFHRELADSLPENAQLPVSQINLNPEAILGSGINLPQELQLAVQKALAAAINQVFLISTIVLALGLLAAFFIREIPLRSKHEKNEPRPLDEKECPALLAGDKI